MQKYKSQPLFIASDFETTINPEKVEVWLSCFVDIRHYNIMSQYKVNNSMSSFINELLQTILIKQEGNYRDVVVFFHNLKFDGSFLLNHFNKINLQYDTLINDMGQWFLIKVKASNFFELLGVEIERDYNIIFRDSLKVMNFSIRRMAKDFNMPMSKGETPLLFEPPNTILPEWNDYVKTDVKILAFALNELYYKEDFKKFTSASESLNEYKNVLFNEVVSPESSLYVPEMLNKLEEGLKPFQLKEAIFRHYFPLLDLKTDEEIRKGYKGGFTFVKKEIQEKTIEGVIKVYDKNSMYPAIQLNYNLPYGQPEIIEEPETINKIINKSLHELDEIKKFFIVSVSIRFDIKKNHLPCIQIKDKYTAMLLGVTTRDYCYSSIGIDIELTFSMYDLDLIKRQYHCEIFYNKLFLFNSRNDLFSAYISKYKRLKENAPTPVVKQKAKIMLNSLYGKFGSKIAQILKEPYFEGGVLKFERQPEELIDPIYVPIALAITSIARWEIINNSQDNYKQFLYSDTDSDHFLCDNDNWVPKLEIHDTKFGAWALEGTFKRAKYIRSKLYIEETENGELDVKGAGMTENVKKFVTFDNFKVGVVYGGKKTSKQTVGGIVLIDSEFTIHDTKRSRV